MKFIVVGIFTCLFIVINACNGLSEKNELVIVRLYSDGKIIGEWESNNIRFKNHNEVRFTTTSGKKVNVNGVYTIEEK